MHVKCYEHVNPKRRRTIIKSCTLALSVDFLNTMTRHMGINYRHHRYLNKTFFVVTDEKKWWKRSERSNDKKNPWVAEPNSVDVEMTAYALLTYLQRGLVEDALPILHWLVSQQNDQGGFASSQVYILYIIYCLRYNYSMCLCVFTTKSIRTIIFKNRSDRCLLYRTRWSRCTRSLRWPRELPQARWNYLLRLRMQRTHSRSSKWPETIPWYCSCSKWVYHETITTHEV